MSSTAERAVATVELAVFRPVEMVLMALVSDSIVFAMDQMAALSLAVLIAFPVEISLCVLLSPELMVLSVCSATMAELLVRMLDMSLTPLNGDFSPVQMMAF